MAKCALEFLQQHGWSAQERRHSSIANSVGVSLESLRNHLLATVPGLKEKGISRTTVHQLLLPPRQKSHNAARYHSIVQARVPGKRNEEASHEHQHVHHCAAQVNLCMEFAAEHYDEIMSFSCDDMNKINIGAMAVSRYHQIRRFFVAGDEPNYPDHDFPLKNNKIIPSGYLCLTSKASRGCPRLPHDSRLRSFSMPATEVRQCTNQVPPMRSRSLSSVGKAQESIGRANRRLTRDKLGHLHYAWPRTGPLHIYLRSSKFYSSSITHHCADLEPLIKEKQKSGANYAVLIADGGPDWSVKSTTTLMALGRPWRDNQLDHLVAVSYAPYQSRFNPIQHAWSPRSNDLTGLRLFTTLDGETVPPSMQSGLSEDDALRKEAVVHDLAITTVASHWAGKKYDGHDVSPVTLECLSPSRHVECDRHEELCKFTSAGVQALSTDSRLKEMKAEYKFFSRHVNRRNHFLAFMKCDDPKCHHCSKKAIQSKKSMAVLRKCVCVGGGGFFMPTLDSNNPDHFMSYQDMSLHLLVLDEKPAAPDQFIAQDGKAPDSCSKCR